MAATTMRIDTDSELQARAQSVLADLGLDMSTAINIFLKQVVHQEAIPFEIAKTTNRDMPQIEYERFLDEMCGCIDDPTFVDS